MTIKENITGFMIPIVATTTMVAGIMVPWHCHRKNLEEGWGLFTRQDIGYQANARIPTHGWLKAYDLNDNGIFERCYYHGDGGSMTFNFACSSPPRVEGSTLHLDQEVENLQNTYTAWRAEKDK